MSLLLNHENIIFECLILSSLKLVYLALRSLWHMSVSRAVHFKNMVGGDQERQNRQNR